MDGVAQQMAMPAPAPLAMRPQNLRQAPLGQRQPTSARQSVLWRIGVFVPALLGTGALVYSLHGWLSSAGMTGLEWALLILIGAMVIWAALSVSTVGMALFSRCARPHLAAQQHEQGDALQVALLMPIYEESPWDVLGNAAAMLNDLADLKGRHRYSLFILSDTQTTEIAAQEWRSFQRLSAEQSGQSAIYYRRRTSNKDKKVGNLVDWITGWGADYDAMLVLDADSLMTGRAIEQLSEELAADPQAGLIQSFPMLIEAHSLFARMQQFSNVAYGWLLAEGFALWSRAEGNYWGHNAIIRTRAFAQSAGLPYLGRRQSLILSHDFVEAGLLRRAGWRVRFLPHITGSFEETPHTVIDYVKRDRRWCRGNLQHLRLLGTAGLHPVSRFHLFQGAMSYLLSPAWFFLLVMWALLGKDQDANVVRYFNEANPLFPDWPPAMSHIDSAMFLGIMYLMLLTPKIAGAVLIAVRPSAVRVFGGHLAFLSAFTVEVMLSVAYAPMLMIQQTKAVARALVSRSEPWTPQQRRYRVYPLAVLVRFHWLETLLGALLCAGMVSGLVSLWLLPIGLSLVFAVPLSAVSAVRIGPGTPRGLRLDSPHTLRTPPIMQQAKAAREKLRAHLLIAE
ncbi:MAG: glucans biosynthesis glucosyltransferase MdoH [Pseudomonadota bacterium]